MLVDMCSCDVRGGGGEVIFSECDVIRNLKIKSPLFSRHWDFAIKICLQCLYFIRDVRNEVSYVLLGY